MRPHLAFIAALFSTVISASCATTMTVSSHVERGLDFATYRSFDWGPADALPTGDPRLDQDPVFKDHVQGTVEKQLAARGIALAASGTPDLVLDMIDARTNRLIWRGWVQKSIGNMLDDRDEMARTIDEAVTRMLKRLPPL